MADLTANDISRLLTPTNEGVRLLTIEQEQTTADIKNMHETLSGIGVTINKIFTELGRVSGQINKPPVIEKDPVQADGEEVQAEKRIKPLETISKHLLDIKEFLVETFKPDTTKNPTKLSQSTEDTSGPKSKQSKVQERLDRKNNKIKDASSNALGWLGSLFTIGAIPVIANTLGIGAAGGFGGNLLSKVLPKIIPVGKAVMRRIPIIGTLLSWYEGYNKIKAGGVDNIVFGLMDIAAGFAYAFPGVGTAIGLGIDVLQYFLNNKAEEWKQQTGNTSFFGSMWDSIITYLKETPMFKWFIETGRIMTEFWNNPTYDTFMAMAGQFGSILQPLRETFSMFDTDAGAALGLTDSQGQAQGLFSWIHDKVDECIVVPVMEFLTGIFESIGDGIMSLASNVHGFIKRAVDNNIPDGMAKSAIYSIMGFGEDIDGELTEEQRADKDNNTSAKEAKLRSADAKRLKEWSIKYGGKFAEPEFLDSIDSMTDSQIQNMLQKVKQKTVQKNKREKEAKLQKEKEMEETTVPKHRDGTSQDGELIPVPNTGQPDFNPLGVEGGLTQNNVNQVTSTTYILPESPSMRVGAIA